MGGVEKLWRRGDISNGGFWRGGKERIQFKLFWDFYMFFLVLVTWREIWWVEFGKKWF